MKSRRPLVTVLLSVFAVVLTTAPAGASTAHVQLQPMTTWRVDGVVRSIAVAGGRTYVGGTFARVVAPDGTTRDRVNLAAFDSWTGALVDGFRADTNGRVNALVSDGSTVWVGGEFTSIGGSSRSRLAAVDGRTGAVRSFRADTTGYVYALDLAAGRLYVGGSFQGISGQARSRAAAVNPSTGAVDGSWRPNPDHTVLAVRARPNGSVVYLGGTFARVAGADRRHVAGVNGSTGAVTSATFQHTYPTLSLALDAGGTRLFAGVAGKSGAGDELTAWNASTGQRVWRQPADGDVQAVAYHRGTVYFGFHEGFGGNRSLRLLAADASSGAIDNRFRPAFDRFWGVYAIAVNDEVLVTGGDFSRVSDVPARGLAKFAAPTTK
jgi:hypothetical protein